MADEHDSRTLWHSLDITHVERNLRTSPLGLSRAEAAARLQHAGPNEIRPVPPPNPLLIFLHQFKSPLIYLLMIAGVITTLLGDYADAIAIAASMALNTVIGFFQEHRAETSARALMRLLAPRTRVVRDGQEQEIASREVVPGDLVALESGVQVPADLRLVAATALLADESLLTGESVPVGKTVEPLPDSGLAPADQTNMAFAGTIIVSGRGRGYVVATGMASAVGRIAHEIREEVSPETPLQRRLERFARIAAVVVAIVAALAFAIGIVQGQPPATMFLTAVALAVSAVPEGLPVATTVTMALGVRRMARRGAIVRRLPAVETLGSTTVIGSDKTGTLTENKMTVRTIWVDGRRFQRGGMTGWETPRLLTDHKVVELPEYRPLYLVLLAGVLTNESDVFQAPEGLASHGDPTEVALLLAAMQAGLTPSDLRERYRPFADIPFEPERQYSASVRTHDGVAWEFVKGAPERVLAMCTTQLGERGARPLDSSAIHLAAGEMAANGLRLLALAYRELPAPSAGDLSDLTYLGLVGMEDPPRAGVLEAIQDCREAGVRVLMITGDHAVTAAAIGRQLGIVAEDAPILTGTELAGLDDAALHERVRSVQVYARVAPEQKLRIVKALRAAGEVVAVTGDGVNDAPALNAADIGIAMGKSGTDVAREAADMVLTDDNFVSITSAIRGGRATFDNIRKVTFFLVSTGAAEVITIIVALALGWPAPLLPAQILWLNLVTNGIQDVALAFERPEPGIMQRPPRRLREGILSPLLWERTIVSAVVMAAGTMVMFHLELQATGSVAQAQTVALTTMVLFQVFQIGNSRSETESAFRRNPFSNPLLLVSTVAALALHVAAQYWGPTQALLRVEPISLDSWLRAAAVGTSVVAAVEFHKLLRRRNRRE